MTFSFVEDDFVSAMEASRGGCQMSSLRSDTVSL